jgi:nucleotide-binding universal stress UspA family protein
VFASLVCAVDDSEESRAALRVSVELARSLEAGLVVAHVVQPLHAPGTSAAPGAADELRREQLADGRELVARLAQEAGVPDDAERVVEVGGAVERLLELVREREHPLLVVGSRGRGAVSSALLGSTSTALAARAACPVLVVSAAAGLAAA